MHSVTVGEWIELYNTTDHPITLANWHLVDDDYLDIILSGVIPATGYYSLERTDDTVAADVAADWAGSFGVGGLDNDGEALTLTNEVGDVIDTANGYCGHAVTILAFRAAASAAC